MKKLYRMAKILMMVALAVIMFFITPVAFAHEGKDNGTMNMDEAMARQHQLMFMFAQLQAGTNESLKKGDATAVEAYARKFLAAISDLKKMMPHKNAKQRKSLLKIATAFELDMKTVALKAKKSDLFAAKTAFLKAENRCNECHAKFRD